jgi:hypothetical protein
LAALWASSAAPSEEEPVAAPVQPEGNWNEEALPVIPATRILAEEGAQGAARAPGVLRILLLRICDEFVAEVLQGRVEGGLRLGQPGFRRSGLARQRAGDGDATWVRNSFTETTTLLESGTPRLVSLAVASFKASLPRSVSVN